MPPTVAAPNVTALEATLARLRAAEADRTAKIAEGETQIRLLEERDAHLLRTSLTNGRSVKTEREALAAKHDEVTRSVARLRTDLSIVTEEVKQAEAELKREQDAVEDAALGRLHAAIHAGAHQWFAQLALTIAQKVEEGKELQGQHAEYQNRFLRRHGKAIRTLPIMERVFWMTAALGQLSGGVR